MDANLKRFRDLIKEGNLEEIKKCNFEGIPLNWAIIVASLDGQKEIIDYFTICKPEYDLNEIIAYASYNGHTYIIDEYIQRIIDIRDKQFQSMSEDKIAEMKEIIQEELKDKNLEEEQLEELKKIKLNKMIEKELMEIKFDWAIYNANRNNHNDLVEYLKQKRENCFAHYF